MLRPHLFYAQDRGAGWSPQSRAEGTNDNSIPAFPPAHIPSSFFEGTFLHSYPLPHIILSHAPFFKHPASSHPPIFKPSQARAGAQISSFIFFLGAVIWGKTGNRSTC